EPAAVESVRHRCRTLPAAFSSRLPGAGRVSGENNSRGQAEDHRGGAHGAECSSKHWRNLAAEFLRRSIDRTTARCQWVSKLEVGNGVATPLNPIRERLTPSRHARRLVSQTRTPSAIGPSSHAQENDPAANVITPMTR